MAEGREGEGSCQSGWVSTVARVEKKNIKIVTIRYFCAITGVESDSDEFDKSGKRVGARGDGSCGE